MSYKLKLTIWQPFELDMWDAANSVYTDLDKVNAASISVVDSLQRPIPFAGLPFFLFFYFTLSLSY